MGKFAPVVTSLPSLPTMIADRLREQIVAGELTPGERLPPERELAANLNVSRSALREATRVLAASGLLDIQHGRGTFVAKTDPTASLATALRPKAAAVVAPRELLELGQVRRIVEPEAAALAARAIKRRDVAHLRSVCVQAAGVLQQTPVDLEAIARLNTELHATIARASGNAILASVVEDCMRLLGEIRRENMRRPGRVQASWCEHGRIVDALEAGDAAAARRLMEKHVQLGQTSIAARTKRLRSTPRGRTPSVAKERV